MVGTVRAGDKGDDKAFVGGGARRGLHPFTFTALTQGDRPNFPIGNWHTARHHRANRMNVHSRPLALSLLALAFVSQSSRAEFTNEAITRATAAIQAAVPRVQADPAR